MPGWQEWVESVRLLCVGTIRRGWTAVFGFGWEVRNIYIDIVSDEEVPLEMAAWPNWILGGGAVVVVVLAVINTFHEMRMTAKRDPVESIRAVLGEAMSSSALTGVPFDAEVKETRILHEEGRTEIKWVKR